MEPVHANNVRLFRLGISNGFERIANSVSEDEFHKTLTILKENPRRAQKLHKAMIKELHQGMEDDLEQLLIEASFDHVFIEAKKRRDSAADVTTLENAWRPPGDVALHLRSLDAARILKETGPLEKQLAELEAENQNLTRKVSEMRSTIMATYENIARSLNQSPQALQRLEQRVDQLEKCVKMFHAEKRDKNNEKTDSTK